MTGNRDAQWTPSVNLHRRCLLFLLLLLILLILLQLLLLLLLLTLKPAGHLGPVVGSGCSCTTTNKIWTKAWHATLCAHLVGASGLELWPTRTTEQRRAAARTHKHTTHGQGVCPDGPMDGRTRTEYRRACNETNIGPNNSGIENENKESTSSSVPLSWPPPYCYNIPMSPPPRGDN